MLAGIRSRLNRHHGDAVFEHEWKCAISYDRAAIGMKRCRIEQALHIGVIMARNDRQLSSSNDILKLTSVLK